MKYCPSCRYTEEEDEPGLINLHHVGLEGDQPEHHTAEEHDATPV